MARQTAREEEAQDAGCFPDTGAASDISEQPVSDGLVLTIHSADSRTLGENEAGSPSVCRLLCQQPSSQGQGDQWLVNLAMLESHLLPSLRICCAVNWGNASSALNIAFLSIGNPALYK